MSIGAISSHTVTPTEITRFVEQNDLIKNRVVEILEKNFGQVKSVTHALFLIGIHAFESLVVRVLREVGANG